MWLHQTTAAVNTYYARPEISKLCEFFGFSVAQLRCPVFWNVAATHALQKNGVLHWSTFVRNLTSSNVLTSLTVSACVYLTKCPYINAQKNQCEIKCACLMQHIKCDPKNSK